MLSYESGVITAEKEQSNTLLVRDAALTIASGRSLALIGETGSGKTMIALSMMGLLPKNVHREGGTQSLAGEKLDSEKKLRSLLGDRIIYIPQNGAECLDPSRTVKSQLFDSLKRLRIRRSEWEERAAAALKLAGFAAPEEILPKYSFQLSGGMAQRVTIALGALAAPALVIADEPTNGLEDEAKASFMALLSACFPRSARLVITHDMGLAALCDDILVLCGGRMMEKGPSRALLAAPKSGYTRALIRALVKNGMHETPVLREKAGDCPFYARCPEAGEACRKKIPHHSGGESEWWCPSC